jgi:hypothetical protein
MKTILFMVSLTLMSGCAFIHKHVNNISVGMQCDRLVCEAWASGSGKTEKEAMTDCRTTLASALTGVKGPMTVTYIATRKCPEAKTYKSQCEGRKDLE